MHDIKSLEERGVIGVAVATTEFADAAKLQSKFIGYDAAVIFVPHPIQDRTDDELRALADEALARILAAVTGAAS